MSRTPVVVSTIRLWARHRRSAVCPSMSRTPVVVSTIRLWARHSSSVERLELVGFHGSLVLVEVCERVFRPVMVGIVVSVNGLGLQTRDGIKLLDGGRPETGKGTENGPLDFGDLRVLHCVHHVSCVFAAWSWSSFAVSSFPNGAILLKFISRSCVISFASWSSGAAFAGSSRRYRAAASVSITRTVRIGSTRVVLTSASP